MTVSIKEELRRVFIDFLEIKRHFLKMKMKHIYKEMMKQLKKIVKYV